MIKKNCIYRWFTCLTICCVHSESATVLSSSHYLVSVSMVTEIKNYCSTYKCNFLIVLYTILYIGRNIHRECILLLLL